ncbi:MAG: methylated-DNA-[protein]-cysteine S-methyltransferase [Sphingobacteriales bacterium]
MDENEPKYQSIIHTPVGTFVAKFDEKYLISFKIEESEKDLPHKESGLTVLLKNELAKYFKGELKVFKIPINPQGTEFQKSVWQQLQNVPFGKTATYKTIADNLSNPSARAVGNANGENPIWVIIPCHRIIGSDGTLTGYAGGLSVKESLLKLEGAQLACFQPTLF